MAEKSLHFFFVLLLFISTSWAEAQEAAQFTHLGLSNSTNLTLNGVVVIQPNRILRLTNDTSRLLGHAFYPQPLSFKNSSSSSASDITNSTDHIFVVELDTVQDFEFFDINDNHVGVDINKSTHAAYFDDSTGSKVDLNLKSGDKIQAWIDYDGAVKLLNVTLPPSPTNPRPLSSPSHRSDPTSPRSYVRRVLNLHRVTSELPSNIIRMESPNFTRFQIS